MTEETGEETAAVEASELPGKCTRLNVLIVVLKPKYLSNLTRKDPFTAENVFLSTGNPEKTDTKPEFRFGTRIAPREYAALFAALKRANFGL
ncbi:hypothetical protein EO92_17575 [Methanosarcina sp. 2.H.A.1B.4]|nr:hypothetical protein EO92_17575 [Methanosarcina sp. 2.H.A.1B.4]